MTYEGGQQWKIKMRQVLDSVVVHRKYMQVQTSCRPTLPIHNILVGEGNNVQMENGRTEAKLAN